MTWKSPRARNLRARARVGHLVGALPRPERYARCFKAAFPGKTLREMTPGDIDRYIAQRRTGWSPFDGKPATKAEAKSLKNGLAPASINRELAFLRRVFNIAIEDRKLEWNPVRPKLFAKENNARVRFLTQNEERRLRHAVGEKDWVKVAIALHTGLRRGEQFALRWENIDFLTRLITIPRSKSGELRRVPMNDLVRDVLRALPSRLQSEWVFPSDTGKTAVDAQNFFNRVFVPALAET